MASSASSNPVKSGAKCCSTINPQDDNKYKYWDVITSVCLIFTCFVSPFEVAFLDDTVTWEFLRKGANPLFWINRLVDLVFILDMILQFMLEFAKYDRYGVRWVNSTRAIRRNYFKTWFSIDLLSILPYDFVGLMTRSKKQAKDLRTVKLLRVLRLLRLLKLMRLLKGLKLVKRYELEMGLPYQKLTLYGLLVSIVLSTHWISCAFGIVDNLQGGACAGTENDNPGCSETWFSPATSDMASRDVQVSPWNSFVTSLYVSATLLVHPHSMPGQNEHERTCFIVLIFIGGFLWTRVLAKSTATLTSMDKHRVEYETAMDDLNGISADMGLPHNMKKQLRFFFMSSKDNAYRATWKTLIGKMSPSLRTQVAYQTNKVWLLRIPYLRFMSRIALCEIASSLESLYFTRGEIFGENFKLYIMIKGLCSWTRGVHNSSKSSVMTSGTCWGEEHLFLYNWELLIPNVVTAMNFCEVNSLDRTSFQKVVTDFEYAAEMRKFYRYYVFSRGVFFLLDKERATGSDPVKELTSIQEDMHRRRTLAQTHARVTLAGDSFKGENQLLRSTFTADASAPAGLRGSAGDEKDIVEVNKKLDELVDATTGITQNLQRLDRRTTSLEESTALRDIQLDSVEKSVNVLLGEVSGLRATFSDPSTPLVGEKLYRLDGSLRSS